jgi:hypothetical protein
MGYIYQPMREPLIVDSSICGSAFSVYCFQAMSAIFASLAGQIDL